MAKVGGADWEEVIVMVKLPIVLMRALFEHCSISGISKKEALEVGMTEYLRGYGLDVEKFSVLTEEKLAERWGRKAQPMAPGLWEAMSGEMRERVPEELQP